MAYKICEIMVALAFAILGGGVCFIAGGFETGNFPDPVTARGLPYLAGGFMALAGTVLVMRRLVAWLKLQGETLVADGSTEFRESFTSWGRAAASMVIALVWSLWFKRLGILVSTPPVMLALLWMMGMRSPARLFSISLGFTLGLTVIFLVFLRVNVPLGPLARFGYLFGLPA